MQILFVNEQRGFFGGVEQCVADSARGLRARGHTCHLAFGSTTVRGVPGFDACFDSVAPCRELDAGGAGPELAGIVERIEPDLVYVHKAARIQPILDAARGRPLVRMVHDHDLVCPRRHKYDAYRGRICRRAAGLHCLLDLAFLERAPASPTGFRCVDVFARLRELARHRTLPLLAGSAFMRQELLRNGCAPESVRVLPPCMDVPPGRAVPPPAAPRLLFVGQLIRGKGVDLLLRAFARLDPAYELDLVGTGNAGSSLAALARSLGVAARVRFHRWEDRDSIGPRYESARMLVVPSRWPEPFGMVGVEAMAHARAVVAFDVGGIPDWLDDGVTGALVREQDEAALAAAIDSVHRTPGRAEALGRAGRERYEREFRFETLVERLETALVSTVLQTQN